LMKRRIAVLIGMLAIALLAGCDDGEPLVGCRLYRHIYRDHIGAATGSEEIHLFFAAGSYEELIAPLTFSMVESESLVDSIAMELYVYGVSPTEEPEPCVEIRWRSDTLLVWYSSEWPRLDLIDTAGTRVPATPPCPLGYYRIDHVIVMHPPDIVVYPHEDVLH